MAAPALRLVSSSRCFGGEVRKYAHSAESTGCTMNFNVYLPPSVADTDSAAQQDKLPWLIFLSGLTCTEDNFMHKAGAMRAASQHRVALVVPDTSPRGLNIPGEADRWQFGVGAGFYLNATEPKWKNWRMYDYIATELPALVTANLPLDPHRVSIFGHSMGGLGALLMALRNPGRYKSVSAFAPICDPAHCAIGRDALSGYLGADDAQWAQWNPTALMAAFEGDGAALHLLIDQGDQDAFYRDQSLLPERLLAACEARKVPVEFRWQKGYDHGYYFISTFVDEHVAHHARWLRA